MAAPRKIKATVSSIKRFVDGVTAFTLKPDGRCRYRSGQFLHLAVEPYDPSFNWPESRVFSIANSPSKSDDIEILVAPKGDFTWNMVNTIKEGQTVWLKLPYGDFNYKEAAGADVVLIAGGTGISPFISFLEEFLGLNDRYNKVCLYYGVRKTELIIYDDLFKKLLNTAPNFSFQLFVEDEQPSCLFGTKTGLLNIVQIFKETRDLSNPVYYLSGPKAMISKALEVAEAQDICNHRIFFDKWE